MWYAVSRAHVVLELCPGLPVAQVSVRVNIMGRSRGRRSRSAWAKFCQVSQAAQRIRGAAPARACRGDGLIEGVQLVVLRQCRRPAGQARLQLRPGGMQSSLHRLKSLGSNLALLSGSHLQLTGMEPRITTNLTDVLHGEDCCEQCRSAHVVAQAGGMKVQMLRTSWKVS